MFIQHESPADKSPLLLFWRLISLVWGSLKSWAAAERWSLTDKYIWKYEAVLIFDHLSMIETFFF